MLFNSPEIILGFLPLALGGFFLAGRWYGTRAALVWLVAADLVFYGWWNPRYIPLLAGSVAANCLLGQRILRLAEAARTGTGRHGAVRCWLIGGVGFKLGLLSWFKYADFLPRVAAPHAAPLGIVLPLAISFFTFQQIMFLLDSAHARRPEVGALPYAALVCFFPHLIAGPIVRPSEVLQPLQARHLARPDAANLAAGLTIFLLGLGKKPVLADTFGGFADIGFGAVPHSTALSLVEA